MPPIFPKILVTFLFTRLTTRKARKSCKSDSMFDWFWPEVNRKLKPFNFSPVNFRTPWIHAWTRKKIELLLMIPLWILLPGQLSFLKWSCSGENLIIFFLVAENEFRFGGGGEYLQWRVIEDNCPNCQFDSTTKPVIMLMEKEEYAATWIKLCKIQNFWEISRDQRSFHPYFR